MAAQEWINERDYFRNVLFGISGAYIPILENVNIFSYMVTGNGFGDYFINQNRFVSHSLIKNKFFGIDITFENKLQEIKKVFNSSIQKFINGLSLEFYL